MTTPRSVVGRDPAGRGLCVEIAGGRIAGVGGAGQGAYLAPGLVDLQVNGYDGIDLNSGALMPDAVVALVGRMLDLGVTRFLPTLTTASEADLVVALRAIAAARRSSVLARHVIPFVHVEGPAISPLDGPRGAHPLDHVRAPDMAEFERWQAASDCLVGMVTLAAEAPGAPAYIAALCGRGVHVALGHSAASPEEIRLAVDSGARLSTHLGNGAAATLPRHPNFIWTQLAEDRLSASFIADGHHLPADTFKAMLRAKGLERAILVSDSVALGGLAPGRYRQRIGGDVELSEAGRISVAGTPYLAGAALPLVANIAIAIEMAGLTLAEAMALATTHPGRFAGGAGLLAPGASADLIRFDWQPGARRLDLIEVIVMGRVWQGTPW